MIRELDGERHHGGEQAWQSRVRRSAGVPGAAAVHAVAELTVDDPTAALARRVRKDPSDARLHVERINRHLAGHEADAAYGALLDAFIAFGPTGVALRARLLEAAAPMLDADRHRALAAVGATGLTAADPMPPSLFSVLSTGRRGGPVLRSLSVGAMADTDLLEAALLRQPWSDELHHALVAHYRSIGAADRFHAMRATLRHSGRLLPPVWEHWSAADDGRPASGRPQPDRAVR